MDTPRIGAAAWRRTGLALLGAVIALAAGCSAPGMKMDAYAPGNANAGGAPSGDLSQRASLYAITPQLVTQMAQDMRNAEERMRAAQQVPAAEPNYKYRVGAQDVLRITVWGHPELTNPSGTYNELSGRVVNSDGTFFFPFVGNVRAAGRTVEEIRDELARGLSSVLKQPQVDVAVQNYRSQRVFISGEVRNPGAILITDVPVSVADAVAAAGGMGPEADLSAVTVTRGSKTFTVDLYGMYYGGDASRNVRLSAGDIVNVPERRYNKVFVLGEVFRPTSIVMPRGRMTLAEALGDVGGVNPLTANAGQIYVLRGSGTSGPEKPQIYHLNATSPDALVLADRFELRSRDVVYVDAVKVVRWARVVNNILPTIDVLRETLNDTVKGLPR
jgi:polysaccharide export outer membrane protein